jgi:hypothetical protein
VNIKNQFGKRNTLLNILMLIYMVGLRFRHFSIIYSNNMLRRGQLWALSRFLLNIYRYPKWDDEIITETWGKGADRIFALRDYTIHSDHELDIKLEKLPPVSHPHVVSSNTVRFSELDVNKHVGAAKYVQWIMDGFPGDVLYKHDIASFEINFVSEANVGDEIATVIDNLDGSPITVLARVIRKDDSKELCKARVTFSD